MDPNAALARIRAVVAKIRDDETARTLDAFVELEEITGAAEALDEWLCGSGFAPSDWRPLMFPQTQREAWAARATFERAECKTCGQDIEGQDNEWRDRGSLTTCPKSAGTDGDGVPIPIPIGTLHAPYRADA